MVDTWKIRRLRYSDYESVKKIEGVVLHEYREYLERTRESDEVPAGIKKRYFDHYVKAQSSFVAIVSDEMAGFILCQPIPFTEGEERILWLDYIALLPRFRRKGIGSQLLSKAEGWAKRHRCSMLHTSLNPNNVESKRLLDRNGFTVKSWREASKRLFG
jgi:GNAT superfamily N-acetyltransferase